MTVEPRHVICVLGTWKTFEPVEKLLAGTGCELDTEYSILERDDRMPRAFDASADRVEPSISSKDEKAIAKHTAVAYVLSPPLPKAEAMHTSARVLRVIGAFLFFNPYGYWRLESS